MQAVSADCADLLSEGVWVIMESRRVRTRARKLTHEARTASQRPRALLEAVMAPQPQRDVDRRQLRAIVRALRRREPLRCHDRAPDTRGVTWQNRAEE